jgi:hypothetical protein
MPSGAAAHELDRRGPGLLDPRHRGDDRVAGCEHGVDEDHLPRLHLLRHLEVVLDRLEGGRVAVQPDVADAGRRQDFDDAVEHPSPGAEHGDDDDLLARDHRRTHRRQRRLDIDELGRQIAGDLVAHQQ